VDGYVKEAKALLSLGSQNIAAETIYIPVDYQGDLWKDPKILSSRAVEMIKTRLPFDRVTHNHEPFYGVSRSSKDNDEESVGKAPFEHKKYAAKKEKLAGQAAAKRKRKAQEMSTDRPLSEVTPFFEDMDGVLYQKDRADDSDGEVSAEPGRRSPRATRKRKNERIPLSDPAASLSLLRKSPRKTQPRSRTQPRSG
jgi:hypothetical protein